MRREPKAGWGRPGRVGAFAGWLLVLLGPLVLAGCGNEDSPYADPTPSVSSSASAQAVAGCPETSPALQHAKVVIQADVDGDGTPDQVKLTGPDSECPNLVFAATAHGLAAVQVPKDGPPVRSVLAITLLRSAGQVLVTRQEHPRGGFQVRLYAWDGSAVRELRVDGQPLVPFVALDVQEHPFTIDCDANGLVLTEAVPHEPHGVIYAWDVRRTTYDVTHARVTETSSEEIADNVLPEKLDRRFPGLEQHAFFEHCEQG